MIRRAVVEGVRSAVFVTTADLDTVMPAAENAQEEQP